VDTRTPEQRSRIMAAVKTENTSAEIAVRRLVFAMGYRYRLHKRGLPGRPDLVFPGRRKAIFVHGCFWHGHGCDKGRLPKSRLDYWRPKIEANRERDRRAVSALEAERWRSLVIWQCELKRPAMLAKRLARFLGAPGKGGGRNEP
jgi:DNA mismatch endonuclease, patch repair protein